MQRIKDFGCYQVIPLMREELGIVGDCVTAGWGTHSVGGLIPGRSIPSINNFDELKSQITLQAFAKSFGTSDGKSRL